MTSGIYLLTNTENGHQYIGQSIDIEKRWSQHSKSKSQTAISRAIRKHGWGKFEKRILIVIDNIDDMNMYEEKLISIYGTVAPNGYNLELGGSNKRVHEESKVKMREAKIGVPLTEAHKAAMSAAHKGVPQSEAHKAARSAALRGRNLSPEHIEKIRERQTGHVRSEESKRKQGESIKGRASGMKGKTQSADAKAAISASQKGKPKTPEQRAKMAESARRRWAERKEASKQS